MMGRFFLQLVVVMALSIVGAVITWAVAPVATTVVCDAATIEDNEVCLKTVVESWGDETVLWVDARARKDWERERVSGAVLLNIDPAEDYEAMLAEAVEGLAMADRVVVYCGQSGCRASKEIVERLESTGLARDVRALVGGMKVLKAGNLIETVE